MQDCFFLIQVGAPEREKGLKRWVSGTDIWPEKGGLEGGTSPYHLPMWVPPPQVWSTGIFKRWGHSNYALQLCFLSQHTFYNSEFAKLCDVLVDLNVYWYIIFCCCVFRFLFCFVLFFLMICVFILRAFLFLSCVFNQLILHSAVAATAVCL